MSNHEAPFVPINGIVDQEGVSIIEAAEAQVAEKHRLGLQQHTAKVEEEALRAGSQAKLDAASALPHPPSSPGPETAEYFRQRNDLDQDANTLATSAMGANERAFQAGRQLAENDAASTAHVDENLPAYVEAATRLANTSPHRKVGDVVAITSQKDGLVGFTKRTPVNPATRNEDVVLSKVDAPAS